MKNDVDRPYPIYPLPSAVVNWDSPTANMYGCEPCPECSSEYRASYKKSGMIECDDCGFKQLYVMADSDDDD